MKKLKLTFKTLIYISLIFFIWANYYSKFYLSNNTIVFDQNTPIRNFILDLPPIFFSISPSIYLCILFTINIIILIFYSPLKDLLSNKNIIILPIFKILALFLILILIIFLILNFIHFINGTLWFFCYSSYFQTYFLFLFYIIFLSLNLYKTLIKIKG